MCEPGRNPRFAREFTHLPFALWMEQQSLNDDARLPSQTCGPCRRSVLWRFSLARKVVDEAGQLDVGVAEPIDDRDSMFLQNVAGLAGGLASN